MNQAADKLFKVAILALAALFVLVSYPSADNGRFLMIGDGLNDLIVFDTRTGTLHVFDSKSGLGGFVNPVTGERGALAESPDETDQ